jgi:hypothetical protein
MNSAYIQSRIATVLRIRDNFPGGISARLLALSVANILILLAPFSAMADTVSGRIYGPDAKPLANATFTAKPAKGDAVEFKTSASGTFSVYLDPGRYAITAGSDAGLEGVIDSYPQPVQQDVHLKKGGK